ncbi:hypothetical protein [Actinoplanes sp. NPDC026619]|uniref:hypothetical protein n=1 Tax=Actinoplanes sp. NPDC026619 TaxID=3155798 RepID=UPI00340D192B
MLRPGAAYAARPDGGAVLEISLPAEAVAALPDAFAPGTHTIPGTDRLVIEVS